MTTVAATERAPARLFIAWQDPDSRRIHPVAVLRHEVGASGDAYTFRYLKHAEALDGFTPFVSFPDLHVEYQSRELFSFFTNRVMSPRRPDFPQFLETLGLPGDAGPVEILARLGARSTDSIEVFPEPQFDATSGRLQTRFFVRGIRHVPGAEQAVGTLTSGDSLRLVADPDNPVNRWAVQVATGAGSILGWVPDYLVGPLSRAVGLDLDRVVVIAERVNPPGTPRQTQVLCLLEVEVSAGFVSFDGPEFVEIDAVPGSAAADG